jgi:hypothetical protein
VWSATPSAGQIKSSRSWHDNSPSNMYAADTKIYKPFFAPKNQDIRPFLGMKLAILSVFFIAYLGPTPTRPTRWLRPRRRAILRRLTEFFKWLMSKRSCSVRCV